MERIKKNGKEIRQVKCNIMSQWDIAQLALPPAIIGGGWGHGFKTQWGACITNPKKENASIWNLNQIIFSKMIKPESQNALPSVTGFSKSSVSDVKSKTYVSKNFKASNLVPTVPGYKIKLKQLSG